MAEINSFNWVHVATSTGIDPCEIEGIDVWGHKWLSTGSEADVRDPLYGQPYRFNIYNIIVGDRILTFAAGGFSACVYGFFMEKPVISQTSQS